MRIAIMQPTYLPWIGYFALMRQVDAFVVLDDVAYSHQSWQQRNRIKTAAGPLWLTVPVRSSGYTGQRICDVQIDNSAPWQRKQMNTVLQSYAKAAYSKEWRSWTEEGFSTKHHGLCDLNLSWIAFCCDRLGLQAPELRTSSMNTSDDRGQRLVDICTQIGADEYLSPVGSFDYLDEHNPFIDTGISLRYFNFDHPTYQQLHGSFASHLSILDLLFNKGPESLAIIDSGLRPPLTHDELKRRRLGTKDNEPII